MMGLHSIASFDQLGVREELKLQHLSPSPPFEQLIEKSKAVDLYSCGYRRST